MTRTHRCGGVLEATLVEIPDTCPPLILAGHRCTLCGEELVSASTALEIEVMTASSSGVMVSHG